MNIVTVYPIIRGAFKDELTYWSSSPLEVGNIIEVPFRNKHIPALVGSVTSASHGKANIKQASFVTRKIEKTTSRRVVREECIQACINISKYYAVSLGSVLKSCIPEIILSSPDVQNVSSVPVQKNTISSDVLVYQTNTNDRLSTYKSIVREEFARKRSMIIVAPTVMSAEELYNSLKKGIEDYVVLIHGSLTKKKQLTLWSDSLSTDHPLLLIVTPLFASIPKYDVGTIVIERESSRAYSAVRTPYIDFREYIEHYAKSIKARLILGDSLLRVETLYRREQGEVHDFFPLSFRIEKSAELILVDMSKKENLEYKDKKEFKILSDELHSMIEYAHKKSERCFIFTARRGLSPQTVCGDCGQTVACDVCNAPVVLHQPKVISGQADPGRFFLCHHCGKQRSAMESCKNCSSWKLVTLGIGIDTVSEEVKKQFPDRQIFKLDKDTATTDKQAKDIVEDFKKSRDGILLGTESSLAYLPDVTYSAIASLDSLFSLPDFRINERICHIILRLLEKTGSYVIIQSRNAKNPILKHLMSGNLSSFYKEETYAREVISYPPFVTHIKITVEDTKANAAQKMKKLQDLLEPHESKGLKTMIFPAFVPTVRGKSVLHMLLTLPKSDWPDEHLQNTIAHLPPDYQVRVNPESLL